MPAGAAAAPTPSCPNTLTLPSDAQWTDPACSDTTETTPEGGSCVAECPSGFTSSGGYVQNCVDDTGLRRLASAVSPAAMVWDATDNTLVCTRESMMGHGRWIRPMRITIRIKIGIVWICMCVTQCWLAGERTPGGISCCCRSYGFILGTLCSAQHAMFGRI
jgi:hypothetical protein